MLRRIIGDAPQWAQRKNPVLSYELVRHRILSDPRSRAARIASWTLFLSVLLLGGYVYATEFLQRSFQEPYTLDVWRALYFPLLILQLLLRVLAISLGIRSVSEERRRQTWDNLRATESGPHLALFTRWYAILRFRLQSVFVLLYVGRLVLLGALLYEAASVAGDYLGIMAGRSDPSVSFMGGVLLLAAWMTAFLLLPVTAAGVDAALGLVIATRLRSQTVQGILQGLLVLLRLGSAIVLFVLFSRFMARELPLLGSGEALALESAFAAFGDWGLAQAQLTQTGQLWATVPYSIFIGVGLLLLAVLQILLTEGLLRFAVRAAERNE